MVFPVQVLCNDYDTLQNDRLIDLYIVEQLFAELPVRIKDLLFVTLSNLSPHNPGFWRH